MPKTALVSPEEELVGTVTWVPVTHPEPHADELLAIALMQLEAPEGVTIAEPIYTPDWANIQPQNPGEQIILIGVGGGEFDEHACGKQPRKPNECAATLVAKHLLKLPKDSKYSWILQLILEHDTQGFGDFGRVMDSVVRFSGTTIALEMMETVASSTACKSLSMSFAEEGVRSQKVFDVEGANGKPVKIAIVESDEVFIHTRLMKRGKKEADCDIVVCKRNNGHVQIFVRNLQMNDLVRLLRLREQIKTLGKPVIEDWRTLEGAEFVEEVPQWYRHGRCVLNGSDTHPEVTPTALTLEEIEEIVRMAYDRNLPEGIDVCRKAGRCWDTWNSRDPKKRRQCPYYKYGLCACREIRHDQIASTTSSAESTAQ